MSLIMSLNEYKESLEGCFWDEDEIKEVIHEMKTAKIGTIKADSWRKSGSDEFIIYTM